MSWFRHHFYCESCDGTWLVEAELALTADCPFCSARDAFPYRSDDRAAITAPQLVVIESRTVTKSGHGKPATRPETVRARGRVVSR